MFHAVGLMWPTEKNTLLLLKGKKMKKVFASVVAIVLVAQLSTQNAWASKPNVSENTFTITEWLSFKGIPNPFLFACEPGGVLYAVQAEGELRSKFVFMLEFEGENPRVVLQDHLTGWVQAVELGTGTEYVASINENSSFVNFLGVDAEDQIRQWTWRLNLVAKGGEAPGFSLVVTEAARTVLSDGTVVRDNAGFSFECIGD